MSPRRSILAPYLGILALVTLLILNSSVQSDAESSIVDWQQPVKAKDIRRFELLNRTAVQIAQSYLDPKRIDPKKMFLNAIGRLEADVPQFVMLTTGSDEQPTAFQLGQFRQDIKAAQFTSIWQSVFHISDALRMIARSGLVHEARLRQLERLACQGMLATLDRHSVVLTDSDLFELKQNTLGRFGGIGVVIELKSGQLVIREVMANTPAHKAGIRAGQYVTEINEDTTENITLNEAAELLRGRIGSKVSLTVHGDNPRSRRTVHMTRTKIDVTSVSSRMLKGEVGYLRIAHFQEQTSEELKNVYANWPTKPRGLIIDLRDNPGGLLDQAIAVSDLFLSQGEIVTTVGHQYEPTHTHFATPDAMDPKTPIVILVNESSASASEIMAAAFKENRRAVILGQPSYGKGTVQVLFEFPNETGLKLTVAQYLTPGRKSIQDVGVQPNVLLRRFSPEDASITASNAHFFRKRQAPTQLSIDFLGAKDAEKTEIEIAHLFLLEHLKRTQTADRSIASSIVNKLKLQYEKTLGYAFSKEGLDWQPEQCEQESSVSLGRLDGTFQKPGGESWKPSVNISNVGQHPTGSMILAVRSGEHVQYQHTGGILPGLDKTVTVNEPIPLNRLGKRCLVSFSLMDSCGRVRAERDELVACQQEPLPSVRSLVHFSDLKHGNRDGVLQSGERGQLILSLMGTNLKTNRSLHAYLTLRGKPRHRIVRLLNGRASAVMPTSPKAHSTTSSPMLTALVFELEGKRGDAFSQTVRQSMSIVVRDDDGKELLRQLFELPIFPSEPTAAVGRRRMATHSEPMIAVKARSPLYFQPEQAAQQIGTASGAFQVLARRGQWYLVSMDPGVAWISGGSLNQRHLRQDLDVSKTSIEPYFIEAGRISFGNYDELSTGEDVTISGEFNGTKLLDYRLFHNGRKRRYRQFDKSHVLARPFQEALRLQPGLNRVMVIVRSTTGHETSETLLITKK